MSTSETHNQSILKRKRVQNMSEALHVFLGPKQGRGNPQPRVELHDGYVAFVELTDEFEEVVTLMGINSMVDGLILTRVAKEDNELVFVAVNREEEEKEFRMELADGYKKGSKHIMEELRKGMRTVRVESLARKPIFRRMRDGKLK